MEDSTGTTPESYMTPTTLIATTTRRTTSSFMTTMASNINSNDTSVVTDYFYQVEQLTFLWILFTLIVIGNATVLIALILSKGRKSRMNFFIKNLAAADLCVGLISVLTDIIWKITISWNAGLVACKIIRFSQATVTYASTYVLVALSIDRYDAITHPMNFSGSWKRAKLLVIIAWALSFLFSLPIMIFYTAKDTEKYGTQCWIDFPEIWQWKLYMTLVSVTLFVIPAILIAMCYIIIVVTIWSKGKDINMVTGAQHSASKANGSSTNKDSVASEALIKRRLRHKLTGSKKKKQGTIEETESRRASSRGLIPKAKVKTIKMTFVIIFVFILCWSPYIVFDLLQVYDCIPNTKTMAAVATFIQSLAPLNSAANPIIYCLFSTNAGSNFCGFFRKRSALSNSMRNGVNSRNRGRGKHHHHLLNSHNTAQTTKSTTLTSESNPDASTKRYMSNSKNGTQRFASTTSINISKNNNGTGKRFDSSNSIILHNTTTNGRNGAHQQQDTNEEVVAGNPSSSSTIITSTQAESRAPIKKTYSVNWTEPESSSLSATDDNKHYLVKALVSNDS